MSVKRTLYVRFKRDFFFPSKDNRHKRFEIESVIKNDSVSFWDLGD